MCSSDAMSNENVLDSGGSVHPSVEPNVMVQGLNAEKHVVSPPQVDSHISDSTSTATLGEPFGDNTSDHMPRLPLTAVPIKTTSKSTTGDDISLNSPSSQIVGTPFAIDSTRFEYPFPDINQNCSSGSSSATPSSSPSSSFPASSSSLTQLSFPLSLQPSYNVTHPMLKVQADPPIPPTLIKRRNRWNVQKVQRWKAST